MIEKIGGRKFVLAVIALLVILVDKYLKLGLDNTTITQLIALVLGYAGINVIQKATEK